MPGIGFIGTPMGQAAVASTGNAELQAVVTGLLQSMQQGNADTAAALRALAEVQRKGREPRSAIQVNPRLVWPSLGDDSKGPKAAEDFFDRFEEIRDLANDGLGMKDSETLITLKSCLHGSRKQIYENMH